MRCNTHGSIPFWTRIPKLCLASPETAVSARYGRFCAPHSYRPSIQFAGFPLFWDVCHISQKFGTFIHTNWMIWMWGQGPWRVFTKILKVMWCLELIHEASNLSCFGCNSMQGWARPFPCLMQVGCLDAWHNLEVLGLDDVWIKPLVVWWGAWQMHGLSLMSEILPAPYFRNVLCGMF